MRYKHIVLTTMLMTGCATQPIPVPSSPPPPYEKCAVKIGKECRPLTPNERAGGAVLGHE